MKDLKGRSDSFQYHQYNINGYHMSCLEFIHRHGGIEFGIQISNSIFSKRQPYFSVLPYPGRAIPLGKARKRGDKLINEFVVAFVKCMRILTNILNLLGVMNLN